MAGIQHLINIYQKNGKDFLNRLFDNPITINEKVEGFSFSVERDPVTRQLFYYKKDDRTPISMIDRTLARFYEEPIAHFDNLPVHIKQQMPKGYRFGFEYISNNAIDQAGQKLILSYIHVKNAKGDQIRQVQDKNELDKWADLFKTSCPRIIFQGHVSSDQKVQILDFLDTSLLDRIKKFKTDSFVNFLISLLNPSASKMGDQSGLVFRFGTESKDTVLAKVIDPIFHDLAINKPDTRTASSDMYYVTLLHVLNFIDNSNFNKFKCRGRTFDERYLDFMCHVFNAFVKENGEEYEDMDFDEPAYLKKPEFDINVDFIKNEETVEHVLRYAGLKRLFKIILASFKKKRRKPAGIFTQDVIDQFNLTIDTINEYLRKVPQPVVKKSISESEIPLFGDFLETRGRTITADEEIEEIDEPLDDFDVGTFQDTMSDISNEEVEEKIEQIKPVKKNKTVNIVVGRFQPFHNGHEAITEDLFAANGRPTMIICVHPGHNKSGHSPFSKTTICAMLDNVVAGSGGKIIGYKIINTGYIKDIIDAVRPEYEPLLWGVGSDRIVSYQKQLEYNFMRNNPLKLSDKFVLMEIKRNSEGISGTAVRDLIYHDEFSSLKKMVPSNILSTYTLLRNDILKYEKESDE